MYQKVRKGAKGRCRHSQGKAALLKHSKNQNGRHKIQSFSQIGEMCRKLETEEEKVLPFGTVPPTPRSKEEDELLQKESNTKLANVVSDYEVRF